MNILGPIQRFLTVIMLYIFRLMGFAFRKLRFAGQGVYGEDKLSDFFDIFKVTLIFFLFNLLALFVFIFLPQGKDVILVVIEDLSTFRVGSLISLMVGLFGWCIISEFGARYKIYVTDNSGLSLSDERVNFRKEAQKFVSSFYLLFPVIIVMLSIVVVSVSSVKTWALHDILPFAIVLLLLVLSFALLSKFYLDDLYIGQLRQEKVWFKVRDAELRWANKLYGIYNDYVFMVRKASNFKDNETFITGDNDEKYAAAPPHLQVKESYEKFTDNIAKAQKNTPGSVNTVESFPRDFIKPDELAPIEFNQVTFHEDNFRPVVNEARKTGTNEPEFIYEKNPDGYYRWIYKCNPSFYKTLHLQVHVIAISSLLFMLFIAVNYSAVVYQFIGSPALVCLSFACWLGIYTGLLYIDSRFKRKIKLSVRWLLVAWFFFVSAINEDHPVRNNNTTMFSDTRSSLQEHFAAWRKSRMADSSKISQADSSMYRQADSSNNTVPAAAAAPETPYPVFFITAEGGALRTGAFTAMLLAKLQDSLPAFKNHIYAFSSVSGGSVGISFFNAISYLEPPDSGVHKKDYYQASTRKFFEKDQLSPVIAKLFYADILNYFWPGHIENFDRAIVLEKAWEHSYHGVFSRPRDINVFSTNFVSCYPTLDTSSPPPAWFINTTEVETGLQCYISNVKAENFLFAKDRDLLLNKIRYGINYSTAVNFSSRFPLFSPSAALYQNDDQTYHYVDGGYIENTGAKTMLELMQSLHDSLSYRKFIPYVIQVKFGDSTHFGQTGFLNELSSIFSGIYNARAGNAVTYTELLKREVKALNGKFIEVPLSASGQEVPMSWVFSKRSLANLESAIIKTMHDKTNDLHTKMPAFPK